MDRYATLDDLEAAWRPVEAGEYRRAEALLEYACEIVAAELSGSGRDPGGDDPSPTIKRHVVCSMVRRAMLNDEREGVSQSSMTVTPYAQSWTYANPDGALYISKAERRLLGAVKGRVGSIMPASSGDLWGEP